MNAFKLFALSEHANLYTRIYYNKPRILKIGHTNKFNKNNSKYEFSKGKLSQKYLKGIMYRWKIKVI